LLNASGAAAVLQRNKIGKEKKIKLPTDGLTNAIQTVRPTDLGTSPIPEAIFLRRSSGSGGGGGAGAGDGFHRCQSCQVRTTNATKQRR